MCHAVVTLKANFAEKEAALEARVAEGQKQLQEAQGKAAAEAEGMQRQLCASQQQLTKAKEALAGMQQEKAALVGAKREEAFACRAKHL